METLMDEEKGRKGTIIVLAHVENDNSPYCSYVHNHAKELVKLGYNVIVFAPINWFPVISLFQKGKRRNWRKIKQSGKEVVIDEVKVIYRKVCSFSNFLYNSKINLNGISYYLHIKRQIQNICKKENVVLIDAHTFKIEGYVASKLKRKYPEITTTVTLHGTSFERNRINKNGVASIKKVFDIVDYAICVSNKIQKELQMLGIHNSKVIYNGINFYERMEEKTEEKRDIMLVTVANLVPNKKVDLVIEAFYEVYQKMEDSKLVIIGKGELENDLKELAKKLEIQDKVIFMGEVTNKEVYKVMRKSKIFLLPSVCEGFGIAYVEAMYNGCITIGTQGEGIDGFIKNGKNGFLVDPGKEEIVNILNYILENPDEMNQIIQSAKADARMLSWKYNAKEYIKNIES